MKLPVWRIVLPLLATQLCATSLLQGAHTYREVPTEEGEDEGGSQPHQRGIKEAKKKPSGISQ